MEMAKRMMATLLCLAMLLSGFAMADGEIDPALGQEQVQSATDSQAGGGYSEPEVTTGEEEDEIDGEDEVDAAASAGSVGDDAVDSTDDSTDNSDPDAVPNDSKQGEDGTSNETGEQGEDGDASDGAAEGPETSDDEESSEDSQEPGAESGESETNETGATGETDEAEDADAGISLLSNGQDVALTAANDSNECEHESEPFREESFEATGVVKYENEDKHSVQYTYRWKVTCLDCGKVLDEGEKTIDELYDHNFTTDSENGTFTCEVCRYSFKCDHEGYLTTETITEPAAGDPKDYVVDKNEDGHTIRIHEWTQDHCEKCDWRGEKKPVPETEPKVKSEPHEWDEENGGKVCLKCGYKNKCKHKNLENVDKLNDVVRATKIDGDKHTAKCVTYANKKCKDCGLIVERNAVIERWTETLEHEFNELSDGTIGCTVPGCGYVIPCDHPIAYREELAREDVGWKEPEQVNEKQHRVRRYVQTYYRCKICGHEWGWDYPDDDTVKVKLENHQWNDEGFCEICGYKNECTQHHLEPVTTSETWEENIACKPTDASTHYVTLGVYQKYKCTICGYIEDRRIDTLNYSESHYWSSEGRCEACGVEGFCKHPDAYVEKLTGTVSRDDLDATDKDEKTHIAFVDSYVNYHCKRCDAWWGYEVTNYGEAQAEPHMWDSDKGSECVICHHLNRCTHEGTTEDFEDEDFRIIPSMTTATTHSKNPYGIKGKHCTECGAYFERIATGSTEEIVTEAHKFVQKDGKTVCEVCGYIKPEQKAESPKKAVSSEKKTEEDAFEVIADGTVVHGVTAGEPIRMGVTMAQAMAGIAAEYGADVKVEILNIDKVLTADECAALNALPPTERILVALGAIGYGDEVENALAELQLTLSEEAQALIRQVNERVAQMDGAAKAAHQQAIEKYFPNANGVSITLEIRKAGETGARKERYGFVQANGVWQFAKLEVAEA